MYTQKESQHIHYKSSVALPIEVTAVPNMRAMSKFGHKNLNYKKKHKTANTHTHAKCQKIDRISLSL